MKKIVFAFLAALALMGSGIAVAQYLGPVPTGWLFLNDTARFALPVSATGANWSRYDGDPRADGFHRVELWRRDDGAWIVREVP